MESNGVYDGGVHNLFVVSGRSDAGACNITQPIFTPAGSPLTGQGGNSNVVFRIPTPIFGAGLIEAIPDSAILANMKANAVQNARAGVHGHANAILEGNVNLSANDGSVTRFGWKAQNKSLLMFAGEAYNVEMGISNQLFPQERDETASCRPYNDTPEDTNEFLAARLRISYGHTFRYRGLCRFHAHARAAGSGGSHLLDDQRSGGIHRGGLRGLSHTVVHDRCGHCKRLIAYSESGAIRSTRQLVLRSAGASHGSGSRGWDHSGSAGPDEFRTAPLWGSGSARVLPARWTNQ